MVVEVEAVHAEPVPACGAAGLNCVQDGAVYTTRRRRDLRSAVEAGMWGDKTLACVG